MRKALACLLIIGILAAVFSGCTQNSVTDGSSIVNAAAEETNNEAPAPPERNKTVKVTEGTEKYHGRFSVTSGDAEKFKASNLPPTYFCYGTQDPFVSQFEKCISALKDVGVSVESNVLENRPHGYGYTGGWPPAYGEWLNNIFKTN